jgi:hypothetical protein
MAWTASAVFRAFATDTLLQSTGTGWTGLDSDSIKITLWDGTITPDKDAASAAAAYAGGIWLTTGGQTGTPQVFHAGQWAQGGVVLSGKTFTNPATGIAMFDCTDPASGTAATMSNVNGAMFFDDTVSASPVDPGACFNWFGGANQVTNGTLTVVINTNGVLRITV